MEQPDQPPETPVTRTSADRGSANGDSLSLCSVPETGSLATSRSEGPLSKPALVRRPTAPNPAAPPTSAMAGSPKRSYRRTGSKSVRFSASSDHEDDEEEDWLKDVDMSQQSGRRWTKLAEFRNLKEIYRGRISLVASAVCKKTGQPVVLKAYIKSKLSGDMREMIKREIRLHGKVRLLSGVVEFLGWFEDQVQIVLVMEHCVGGDLYRSLVLNSGEMNEQEAVQDVLSPLLHTLLRVHRYNICHRDLKPENLFFSMDGDRRELKVGDFGLASDLPEMRDRLGTLDYMAPEIILQKDETSFSAGGDLQDGSGGLTIPCVGPYTMKVDVWSVGIIAYELIAGRPPFEVSSPKQTAMLIVWGQPKFPSSFSDLAKDFICQALQKDPDKRPPMVQLLQHPWIASLRTSDLPTPGWLQQRGSFSGTDDKEPVVLDHRKSAPEVELHRAQDSDGFSSARGTSRLSGKRGVRRAATVRDLAPAQKAAPVTKVQRKPLRADRTFNVGSTRGLAASQPRPTRIPRHVPRSSAGSSSSLEIGNTGEVAQYPNPHSRQAANPNPLFARPSRSRRESKTYTSDDSIEEEPSESIDLDSAAKLAKAGQQKIRRKSRLSDCSVDENEVPAAVTRAMLPDLLKGQEMGSSDTSSSVNVSASGVANIDNPEMSKTGVDQRKDSLFRRFFSAIFTCGAHPGMAAQPSDPARQPSVAPSNFSVGLSEDNLSTGDASQSSTATGSTTQRRISRHSNSAAVRIAASMNRVRTRLVDEAPPWTTGAQQLQGTAWSQPDEKELEAIQSQAVSSTRNRVVEYMVRRGGTESSRKSLAEEKMPETIGEGVQEAKPSMKVGQPPWLAADPVISTPPINSAT